MITFYSGTPGSGKSLHTAQDILTILRNGHNVIANFPVELPKKYKKKKAKFFYVDNSDLTVKFLHEFAVNNHKVGKEGQTTVIIDECAIMFNSREWDKKDRNEWLVFFQQHRKLGYNVLLIAQNDRMIDRQIRSNFEYEVKHRKANNYGVLGLIITAFRIKLFAAITYWYGVKEKCGTEFFTYKKKYSKLYDTYAVFENPSDKKPAADGVGDTGAGSAGGPPEVSEAIVSKNLSRPAKGKHEGKTKLFNQKKKRTNPFSSECNSKSLSRNPDPEI